MLKRVLSQIYIRDMALRGSGHLIRLLSGFAVSVLIARSFGPEAFGTLNFSIALVAFAAVVGGLGLERVAKRDMLDRPEARDTIIGTCTWLSLGSSLLALGIALAIALSPGFSDTKALLVAALSVSLLAIPFAPPRFWFETKLESRILFFSLVGASLASAAAKVACVLLEFPLWTLGLAIAFEPFIAAMVQVTCFRDQASWRFPPLLDRNLALRYLGLAWPLMIASIAITTYTKIDIVMLSTLSGDTTAGHYSAAVRISTICHFLPTLIGGSLLPAIHKARGLSGNKYQGRVQNYFDFSTLLALLIATPLFLASPFLLPLVFGAHYASSVPVLQIHAWTAVFLFLGVARTQVFTIEGWFRLTLCATLAGAIANVLLNFVLIPRYGGPGAAAATLFSQIVAAVATTFVFPKSRWMGFCQLRALILPLRPQQLFRAMRNLDH